MKTVEITTADFKKLLSDIMSSGHTSNKEFELHPIPPFDELEKELDISSDIELSEFCSKMINDANYLKRLKIFKKDRIEWGYFRYKILIQNKKGEMFYAFDLNQYTNQM
jgi:hypothetical protein